MKPTVFFTNISPAPPSPPPPQNPTHTSLRTRPRTYRTCVFQLRSLGGLPAGQSGPSTLDAKTARKLTTAAKKLSGTVTTTRQDLKGRKFNLPPPLSCLCLRICYMFFSPPFPPARDPGGGFGLPPPSGNPWWWAHVGPDPGPVYNCYLSFKPKCS